MIFYDIAKHAREKYVADSILKYFSQEMDFGIRWKLPFFLFVFFLFFFYGEKSKIVIMYVCNEA